MRGLSLAVASGGHSSLRCAGLSLSRPLVAEHRLQTRRLSSCGSWPSCSAACGILPDQGSNPCPLHWQADSQPLRHQGSPKCFFLKRHFLKIYFWLRWVFIAAHRLSLVGVSGGYSLWWLLLLRSTGSRHTGFSSCGTQAQ